MEKLLVAMLGVLVAAVTSLAVVTWRAADQAHDDQATLICLQQAQTTATIAMLAPAESIDEAGRIKAMQELGRRTDACKSE